MSTIPGSGIDLVSGLAHKDILDALPDGVVVTDARGSPLYLNMTARQLLMPASRQDVTGALVDGPVKHALRGEGVEQADILLHHEDGRDIWARVNARPLKNPAGQTIGAVALLRDVSQRKQEAAELRERLERMELAVSAANMGVWEWDVESSEIKDDAMARRLLGRKTNRPISMQADFFTHIHPDDRERVKATLQQSLADGAMRRIEYRCVHANGEVRWVADRYQAIAGPNGDRTLMVGVVVDITRNKRLEAALKESEWRFRNAMRHAPIGMALVDVQGHWLEVNRAVCKMLGYSSTALKRQRFQDITHADDLETDLAYMHQLLNGEIDSYQMEKRYLHQSGRIVHTILSVSLLRAEDGAPLYFISQIQDITERRKTEEVLRQSEERLRTITNNLPVMIGYADSQERFQFVNKTYQKWFGIPLKAIQGESIRKILGEEEYKAASPHLHKALSGRIAIYERTLRGDREVQATYLPHIDKDRDGEVKGFYILVNDITERKRMEAKLREMAQHDTLTGLPNRRLLYDRLGQAIERTHRHNGHLALLFMDLNGFKQINDTYGHDVGDQALIQFAERVKACLRHMDTAARLAGDEFVVIVEEMKSPDAAAAVANKIQDAMRAPMQIGALAIETTPSIGIVVYDGKESVDSLIKRADAAMYESKARAKRKPQSGRH